MLNFRLRLFIYKFKDRLFWYIAYLIPRKIALICFVRVYSTLGSFSEDYELAYDAWESGKGK